MGQGVAADRRREHAGPRVRARRRRRATPRSRSRQTARRRPPDAAPAPDRHRPVRRGGRPPGPSPTTSRSTSRASRPSVDELVGASQPDLLLLNDGDLAYAKIRLDERSLATVVGGLAPPRRLPRPRPVLGRGLGHDPRRRDVGHRLRDAGARATSRSETDAFGVTRHPRRTPPAAVTLYSAPEHRAALRATLGDRACATCSTRPSPAATTSSPSPAPTPAPRTATQALDDLEGLLDGSAGRSRASRSTPTCAGRC